MQWLWSHLILNATEPMEWDTYYTGLVKRLAFNWLSGKTVETYYYKYSVLWQILTDNRSRYPVGSQEISS